MQINGLCFRSLFRNYEVINTTWQTFLSKMRGAEEVEISAGRGELKIHALLVNLGHFTSWRHIMTLHDGSFGKTKCSEGMSVVGSVPSTFLGSVLRRLYDEVVGICWYRISAHLVLSHFCEPAQLPKGL